MISQQIMILRACLTFIKHSKEIEFYEFPIAPYNLYQKISAPLACCMAWEDSCLREVTVIYFIWFCSIDVKFDLIM